MKTFTRWILTTILLCQISACSTPEQRQAQERQRQAVERAALAQRVASLDARCRGYGFELKTTGFAQCVMKLDQADRQTARLKVSDENLNLGADWYKRRHISLPENQFRTQSMPVILVWPDYPRQEAIKSYVGGKVAMSFIALTSSCLI